jgi:mono/diheme cytochrome c family protein
MTDTTDTTASTSRASRVARRVGFWPIAVGLMILGATAAWGQASSQASEPVTAVAVAPSPVGAQELAQGGGDGAAIFADSCASCHGANGEGVPGTFPPLAGNPNAADAEYVAGVAVDGLSGPIEVLGETYDSVMPSQELSSDEAAAVAEFVSGLAGDGGGDETPTSTTAAEPPEAGEVAAGRDLFVGGTQLTEGGPACAACHTAGSVGNRGGPGLGPDLTDVAERLGGEAGLAGWLANPPTETMTELFADDPLTEAEIADLSVFLVDAPEQDDPDGSVDTLALAGVVGALILFGGMAVAYRGMRQTYVERLKAKAGAER